MNLLVTGYPGWLSTRMVERILKEHKDWNLRCLVLRGSLNPLKVDTVTGDVRELYTLIEATRDIDLVIHAAGIIHGKPKTLMEVNAQGTLNMLKACEHNEVKRIIYISSNSAVGHSKEKTLMDEGTFREPYMSYGKSKWLAEEYVRGYWESRKIKGIILRPCWYYGPNQPERQTKLFKMIKSGKPIIFGDGRNLRSMTYIDNLIDAIFLAAESDTWNTTYWIADERPYTTIEIYETIAELLGVDIKPIHIPSFTSSAFRLLDRVLQKVGIYSSYIHVAGEMTLNIACDISKAKRELGYEPKISLREGMYESIKWCKRKNLI